MQKIIVHVGKWLWHDSLWHKVVCNAYGAHANGWDAKLGSVVSHLSLWKFIPLAYSHFLSQLNFKVGNGICILVWEDLLLGETPFSIAFSVQTTFLIVFGTNLWRWSGICHGR